jgi:hypothetical protein
MIESAGYLLEKLEGLLVESFAAKGDGLEAKVSSVAKELPEELQESLHQLARQSQTLGEGEALAFAFQCGQAYERLESVAQNRLAANIAFLGTDGTPPVELEKTDLDAIARFVKWRDQMLKTVADYTLKFLLVSVILLVLGLSVGLI